MEDQLFSHQNFIKLSQEVQEVIKKQKWAHFYGSELLKFLIKSALFIGTFVFFAQPGWFFKFLGMIVLSFVYYSISITGIHESSHRSLVKSTKGNKLWGYFFSDFWVGQSSVWWHHHHVEVHHVYTNIPDVEPNLYFYPWLNRYLYFFAVPYLILFWMIYNSIHYLWKKWSKLVIYLTLMIGGYLFHFYLFSLVVPTGWAIACVFIMRSLYAPVFLHIATFNHIGLDNPKTRPPWLPHQTNTTRNMKPSWFLSVIGGNAFIEAHIEHHLFPTLSNHILKKIRPIVVKYLKKEGYKYVEESYWYCLKNCIKYYKTLFQNVESALPASHSQVPSTQS